MRRLAAGLAFGLVLTAGVSADAQARRFAPWPGVELPAQRPTVAREPEESPVKLPFLWGLWFYRNAISPLDGVRCGLYPTCSGYATEAVRKHGPLAGGFLAADRLIHEASVRPPEYPVIEKFERRFLHDPVEANDRLFRRGPAATPTPVPAIARFAVGTLRRDPPAALVDAEVAAGVASSLAASGDRYRAVGEFRRAAFLSTDDVRASALLVEGGWVAAAAGADARRKKPASWSAGEEAFDEADRLFEDADLRALGAADFEERGGAERRAGSPPGGRTADQGRIDAARRAGYARALAYLSRGYHPEAARRFKLLAMDARDELSSDAAWLGAWSELSRDLALGRSSRAAASDRFEPFLEDPARAENARALIEATRGSENWSDRSPTAAAVMSFVLPGSGYVYAGRPLVGLGALALNGAFIAGTVLAFQDGNYPLAAILLSLETGWYVGGATGAALEVVDRNEVGRKRVERRLRKKYMGTVWPGGAAGALLF